MKREVYDDGREAQGTADCAEEACRADCEFYDYDENWETYTCRVSLDEDEMGRFTSGQTGRCPYFRYYDEYKSVHKQI